MFTTVKNTFEVHPHTTHTLTSFDAVVVIVVQASEFFGGFFSLFSPIFSRSSKQKLSDDNFLLQLIHELSFFFFW